MSSARGINIPGLIKRAETMKGTHYFSHDSAARNAPKLQRVLMTHGCAGIGIYWCIVEMLYEQGGVMGMDECDGIAFALHTERGIVESIVKDFGLFECGRGRFWSDTLKEESGRRAQIADKRKAAALKRWGGNAEMEHKTAESEHGKAEVARKSAEMERKEVELERKATAGQETTEVKKEDGSGDVPSVPKTPKAKAKESDAIDFKKIAELYHTICKSYPKLLKFSEERKAKVRIRFHDEMKCSYELLEDVFRKMEESKFLRGDNKNGWKATFDWLFANPKNWVKVAEGNYDNRRCGAASASPDKDVNSLWNQPQQ